MQGQPRLTLQFESESESKSESESESESGSGSESGGGSADSLRPWCSWIATLCGVSTLDLFCEAVGRVDLFKLCPPSYL